MISLIVLTYRPGGIDLLTSCLATTQSPEPWELVVVDDFPGRVERGFAAKYLREQNIPLGWYGTSKPKSYPETKGGLCNATNTALFHAKGNYLVFVSDYTILPHYWMKQWTYWRDHAGLKERALVTGSAIMYDAPKPTDPRDVVTWQDNIQMQAKWPWVPDVFETFYWGCPIEFLLETNGLDERADHCHCWPVDSTIAHAKQLGWHLLRRVETACHMIDHRIWDTEMKDAPPPSLSHCGMWRIDHQISSPEDFEWVVPAPNPFNLMHVRDLNGLGPSLKPGKE